LALTNLNS